MLDKNDSLPSIWLVKQIIGIQIQTTVKLKCYLSPKIALQKAKRMSPAQNSTTKKAESMSQGHC